eukprot:351776-Chlamydomonas_euryale.AAC.10
MVRHAWCQACASGVGANEKKCPNERGGWVCASGKEAMNVWHQCAPVGMTTRRQMLASPAAVDALTSAMPLSIPDRNSRVCNTRESLGRAQIPA